MQPRALVFPGGWGCSAPALSRGAEARACAGLGNARARRAGWGRGRREERRGRRAEIQGGEREHKRGHWGGEGRVGTEKRGASALVTTPGAELGAGARAQPREAAAGLAGPTRCICGCSASCLPPRRQELGAGATVSAGPGRVELEPRPAGRVPRRSAAGWSRSFPACLSGRSAMQLGDRCAPARLPAADGAARRGCGAGIRAELRCKVRGSDPTGWLLPGAGAGLWSGPRGWVLWLGLGLWLGSKPE